MSSKRRNSLAMKIVPIKLPLNIIELGDVYDRIEVDVYDMKSQKKLGRYKVKEAWEKFG